MKFGRIAARLALALAGLYLYVLADLYFNQAGHVYHPKTAWTTTPEAQGMSFLELTLTSSDGTKLSAWYIPALGSKGTVLVCHGNSRNMSSDMDVIGMFHKLDQNVMIVDYR